ncbi:MAG TPA: TM2 domain-containing protein, partial [Ktedonobacterales bacterium]
MELDMSSIAAHLSPGRRTVVETLYAKKARSPLAAFLLCFFVGPVGLHHAYLRQWGRIWGHLPLPAIALAFAGLGLGHILTTSVALIGFLIAMGGAIVWSLSELRTVDGAADTWNAALAQRLVDQADSGQLDARIPAVTRPATADTSVVPVAAAAIPFVAPALPPVAPEPVAPEPVAPEPVAPEP